MKNKELFKCIIKVKKTMLLFPIEKNKKEAIREIYNNLYKSLKHNTDMGILNMIKCLSAFTQIQIILQDPSVLFSTGGIIYNDSKCGELNIYFKESHK